MTDKLSINIIAEDNATGVINEVGQSIDTLKVKLGENKEAIKTLLSAWTKAEAGAVKLRVKIDQTTKSLGLSGKKLTEMAGTIGTEFGSSLSGAINKSLSDLPDLMFSWGSSAASMFASGLTQGSHEVEASAYRISDMLAGYFEMHSPARLGPLSKEDPANWTKRLVVLLANGLVSAEDILTEKLQKISGLMTSAFNMDESPQLNQYISNVTSSFSKLFRKIPSRADGSISQLYSKTGVDFRKSENILKMREQDKLANEFRLFRELLTKSKPSQAMKGRHEAFTGGTNFEKYFNDWFGGVGSARSAVSTMLSAKDQSDFERWMKNNGQRSSYYKDENTNRWRRRGLMPSDPNERSKFQKGEWKPTRVADVGDGVDFWDEFLNKDYEEWLESRKLGNSAYNKATHEQAYLKSRGKANLAKKYSDYVQGNWSGGSPGFEKILERFSDTKLAGELKGSETDPATGLPLALVETDWWKAFVREKGDLEGSMNASSNWLTRSGGYSKLEQKTKDKMGLAGKFDIGMAIKMMGMSDDDDSAASIFGQIYNMMKTVSGGNYVGGEEYGWLGNTKQEHFSKIAEILGVDYTKGSGKGYKRTSNRWDAESGDWGKLDLTLLNRLSATNRYNSDWTDKESADYLAEKIAKEWTDKRKNSLYSDINEDWKLSDTLWTSSNKDRSSELLIELLTSMSGMFSRGGFGMGSLGARTALWSDENSTGGMGGGSSLTSPLMYDFTQHVPKKYSKPKDPRKYWHGRDQHGNDLYLPRQIATRMMAQNENWIKTDYVDARMAQLAQKRKDLGARPDHSSLGVDYSPNKWAGKKSLTGGGSSTSLSVGAIQVNQNFHLDLSGYEGSIQELVATIAQEAAIEAQKALLDMVEFRGV